MRRWFLSAAGIVLALPLVGCGHGNGINDDLAAKLTAATGPDGSVNLVSLLECGTKTTPDGDEQSIAAIITDIEAAYDAGHPTPQEAMKADQSDLVAPFDEYQLASDGNDSQIYAYEDEGRIVGTVTVEINGKYGWVADGGTRCEDRPTEANQ